MNSLTSIHGSGSTKASKVAATTVCMDQLTCARKPMAVLCAHASIRDYFLDNNFLQFRSNLQS
jgi:hypothetical protein